MEFRISRISSYNNKPCKEAKRKEFVYVDRRTPKTLEEAKLPKYKHWSNEFFASGTNHREEKGMIARDCKPHKLWVIDIDTLESLIKLVNKYGRLILEEEDRWKGIEYSIEVYDDYRE